MKSKPQGRLEGTLVGNILKTRLAVIAANWVFQGMRYMNGYEIGLKLILDAITAIFLYYFMFGKISTILAFAISIIIAHTINWIINGHFFVLMRYVAPIPKTEQHFADSVYKLKTSALKWNSIDSIAIYGSYCRGNLHKYSDLDVRVITHPGALNAINGSLFCFMQRAIAFLSIFPLDIYCTNRIEQLDRLRDDEKPIILFDNTGRLSSRYDTKAGHHNA